MSQNQEQMLSKQRQKTLSAAFRNLLERVSSRVLHGASGRSLFNRDSGDTRTDDIFKTHINSSSFLSKKRYSHLNQQLISSSQNHNKLSSPEQLTRFQNCNKSRRYLTTKKSRTPSKRCSTDTQEFNSSNIYGRITHYNQLLITKSFMFKETIKNNSYKQFSKHHLEQIQSSKHINKSIYEPRLRRFSKKIQTKTAVKMKQQQLVKNNKRQIFQPWDTGESEQTVF